MTRREHNTLLGLGAALVATLAVVVVILLFGIRHPPTYPSLADAPDPTVEGWLLFKNGENEHDSCLFVRSAGGGKQHQVTCDLVYVREASVDADGRLLVGLSDESHLLVDPDTGAIVSRDVGAIVDSSTATPRVGRSGAVVNVVNDDEGSARVIIHNSSGEQTLLQVSGPADYALSMSTWSPDGKWIVVRDTSDRLLLIDADGDSTPRILLSDIPVAWWTDDGKVTWVQTPDP